MPTYEFQRLSDGQVIEWDFPMSEAPEIGERLVLGRHGECDRIVSSGLVMRQTATIEPFVAHSLNPQMAREYGHTDFDPETGGVRIGSKRAAEALEARSEGEIHFRALPAACETRHRESAQAICKRRIQSG